MRPKLRFPEFRDEWTQRSLAEFLIQDIREVPIPGRPYLGLGIRSHFKGTLQRPNSEPEKLAMDSLYKVRSGDLIVNITFAWEGAVAIASPEDEGGLVSHRFPTYRFDQNVAIGDFFRYVFPTKRFKFELDLASPGGAGRNRVLNKKEFLKIRVRLPSVTEQTKIADFLTVVDEKIAAIKKKKELLEQYKKGVMQAIFSQRVRFRDPSGNPYPDWKEQSLNQIVEFIRNGLSYDQNANPPGYMVTRIETISSGKIDIKRVGYIDTDQDISGYKLRRGDLLFSNINSPTQIGKIVFVDKDYDLYHGMNLLGLRFKSSVDAKFVFYVLSTNKMKRFFERICNKAVNQASINQTDLGKTKLLLPIAKEQRKIADFLTTLDQRIELEVEKLEQAQQFKKALLQQMLS